MTSTINTNTRSLTVQANLARSTGTLSQSIGRLSSGLRINSAADDAAGYAISQNLSAKINGSNQAIRNANDAVSLAQTAGGAINQITSDLQRIRQLAVQSANGSNSANDRSALQKEAAQLIGDISSIGAITSFNGNKLLDGGFSGQSFQVGSDQGQNIQLSLVDLRSDSLGAKIITSSSGVSTSGSGSVSLTGGLTINGTTIDTSSATGISGVVATINSQSATTGVYAARANTNINTATYATDAANANTVSINGRAVLIPAGSTAQQAVDSFNAASGATGVSATASGNLITFSATNGGDFALKDDASGGVLSDFNSSGNAKGLSSTFQAGITLSTDLSRGAITVAEGSGTTAAGLHIALTGLALAAASHIDNASQAGGAVVSYSNTTLNNPSFTSGSVITLTNVIVNNLNLSSGATVNGSGVLLNGASLSSGAVLTLSGSQASGVSTGSGAVFNNSSPATLSSAAPGTNYQVSAIDISTQSGAVSAITTIDFALTQLSRSSAQIGAAQNRFTAIIANLQSTSTNLSASLSTIQDADFAQETATLTRGQVLTQAATAVLAQANSSPNLILQLLR